MKDITDINKINSINRLLLACNKLITNKININSLQSFINTSSNIFDNDNDKWFFLGNLETIEYTTEGKEKKKKILEIVNLLRLFLLEIINKNKLDNFIKGLNGLILYGPYTSYSIYIDQDTDTKGYTIYLWKKDIENSDMEFKIKNKEELQKFFEDNDILVEWEENDNS